MLHSLLSLLPDGPFAETLATYVVRLPAALGVTLRVTFGATLIAVVLGMLVAIGRASGNVWVSWSFAAATNIGRCIPLPPLQLLVYFMLLSALPIDAATAGMLAIGLHFAPYMAELFRSGIAAIPRGQIEAAETLGFSVGLVRRRVVLPMAIRLTIPAVGQLVVGILLNSAFVSQIGARDITGMGRNIINATFSTDLWLVIAFTYFVIAFPVSRLLDWLERRLAVGL